MAAAAALSFEYIGRNVILTRDKGKAAENITENAYANYTAEVESTGRTDIELIPREIYLKLIEPDRLVLNNTKKNHRGTDRFPPAIARAIKPYQAECVWEMVRARRALNACLMGMGKSIQAICTIALLRDPSKGGDVVVCPGGLRSNWSAEIKKWAPDMNVHMIDSVGTDPAQIQLRITQLFSFSDGLTIISYELFARLAGLLSMSARKLARFNTIVCDESHYLKETTSVRYKALRMHLLHAHNLFLLSGTPSPNRPVELFAQLQLLDSATFRSKETFSMRYCDGFIDQWGRFNARGASRERELAILLSRYMIRVTVNPDISSVELREVHRVVTEVEIEGLATNHAEQVRDVIQAVSSGAAAMNDVQSTVSALFLETARLKVGPILVLLRERLAGLIDEKVVLFCTHMVMFEAVKAELETSLPGKKHIAINGLTPMRGREAMVAEFLGPGDCRVALLTLGTCSTGINLVPVRHAIFLELDWTPAIIHQAECRINRIGGAASLYYEYLIAPNTLDDYVYRMLHRKSETICAIVDRGHTDAFNFG